MNRAECNSITVWMTIGPVGSGKSTWAGRMASLKGGLIVSKDDIRQMLLGRYGFDDALEPLVDGIAGASVLRVVERFMSRPGDHHVVVDDTYLKKAWRRRTAQAARAAFSTRFGPSAEAEMRDKLRLNWMQFEWSHECLERRRLEHRGMGEDYWRVVFDWMSAEFEPPTRDEGEELGIAEWRYMLNGFVDVGEVMDAEKWKRV